MPATADCAQALPQSCANGPIPSRPLAPKLSTVFSGGPLDEQVPGTFGNAASPITWIASPGAASPAIVTSALRTDPQLYPSTNCAHSAIGLPAVSVCCGRASVGDRADARMRSPSEPVSSCT